MAKKIISKKKTTKSKVKISKRIYNNTSRQEKSDATQTRIIAAVVDFLARRRGGEINFSEISKASKISERTIFRFFKDKQALHEATVQYLQSYIQEGFSTMYELDIAGFTKNTFELFEKHENLVMAYLFSPFGQHARDIFRKKIKQIMIQKITKDSRLEYKDKNIARIEFIVSLVNARLWHEIKEDSKLTTSEIAGAAGWAVETLLKNL